MEKRSRRRDNDVLYECDVTQGHLKGKTDQWFSTGVPCHEILSKILFQK
jgi:hypothetical protein